MLHDPAELRIDPPGIRERPVSNRLAPPTPFHTVHRDPDRPSGRDQLRALDHPVLHAAVDHVARHHQDRLVAVVHHPDLTDDPVRGNSWTDTSPVAIAGPRVVTSTSGPPLASRSTTGYNARSPTTIGSSTDSRFPAVTWPRAALAPVGVGLLAQDPAKAAEWPTNRATTRRADHGTSG